MSYTCLVLTMIFSMAESVPLQYYTHLDAEFVTYLFNLVEHPPDADTQQQVCVSVCDVIPSFC